MKQYDMIELNTEINELSECGIHKGCTGSIALFTENESLALFLNPDNYGDYAFAWVENKHLTFTREHNPKLLNDFIKFLSTHKPESKPKFQILKLKEYDLVELLVEKTEYAKAGVHKGMTGTILLSEAHKGKWSVTFTADDGEDIAELSIPEEHLKKIK